MLDKHSFCRRKWTIICVNYFSEIYIRYQLKIFYEFNNPNDFQFVIVDNSNNIKEFKKLLRLKERYSKFNNLSLIDNATQINLPTSVQHAKGINLAMKFAEEEQSEYLLVIDPDCFVLRQNFLQQSESFMKENEISFFGTPYSFEKQSVIKNYKDFPCAFACAFALRQIGYDLDFMSDIEIEEIAKTGNDVGFKIREKFGYMKYISFDQTKNVIKEFKDFNYRNIPKEPHFYFYNNIPVAVHIVKSSRPIDSMISKSKIKSPIYLYKKKYSWNRARKQLSKHIYELVRNNIFFTSSKSLSFHKEQ